MGHPNLRNAGFWWLVGSRKSVLLFGLCRIQFGMRISFSSLTANFIQRRIHRLRWLARPRLAHSFAITALIFYFIPCGKLAAQQSGFSDSDSTSITSPAEAANSAGSADQAGQAAQTNVPDAPATQVPNPSDRAQQTNRILGIIPNFRAISTDDKLPAQSVKEKFETATEDSFDYSSAVLPALLAGLSLGTNAVPEFGHGGVGYSRYLWHSAVDQTSENYMVEFVVPSITHEDTRYYTLGNGGFLKRTGYALSRAVVTRSDAGRETFNISEVVGSGASAGLSSLYYPTRERSIGNTGTEWGLDIAIDAASFVAKEFWPDINRHLFQRNISPTDVTGR